VNGDQTPSGAAEPPTIRIESGNPTPEEIAALVTVLTALSGGGEPATRSHRSAWSDPSWQLIGPASHRGGWRASGLPR
jgi:acyl-CoA carboxylase epsilon subunit